MNEHELLSIKKQLVRSLFSILLCLVVTTMGTYAWFSAYRKLNANGVDVELAYDGAVITGINIYKYIQDTGEVQKYVNDDDVSLTVYDSIFTERNVNTPLVFEVTLFGKFDGADTLTVTLECSNTVKEGWREEFVTSNLIYMKAATKGNVEGLDTTSDEKIFYSVCDYFKGLDTKTQFLTVDDSHELVNKVGSIALDIDLADGEADNKINTIYLILDYEEKLVVAHNLDEYGFIEITDNEFEFADDITKLKFRVNYTN